MSDRPENAARIAAMIDHTLLKPNAMARDVEAYCVQALEHGFASVCVNPIHVPLVAERLHGSKVKTCSVVGFPLGAIPPMLKAGEAAWACENGADEIDMVIDIGSMLAGEHQAVEADIRAVREASPGRVLKVIIETCFLGKAQKEEACRIAEAAGADFVKTSTGFGSGGATEDDVRLMRGIVGDRLGVKASGGIRTPEDFDLMVAAGANRIGASAGLAILKETGGDGTPVAADADTGGRSSY
ncbi:deoxyribose-phosphate aldolase [Fulvimarina sp. MAC8]|uniref:deoxyribose-phosphate aldolase n=1 Tax=Fulvimarina sp. MAC8 TaxID=3162874 RepID=UPI0032EC3933